MKFSGFFSLITFLLPTINPDDFKINFAFEPKLGFARHSAIITLTSYDKKAELLAKCKELKTRTDENSWLRKVFIRSDQPPLTSKENTRLYNELKKFRTEHDGEENTVIKLVNGFCIK